jgi:hypothetical protein
MTTHKEFESLLFTLLDRQMDCISARSINYGVRQARQARDEAWDAVLKAYDTQIAGLAAREYAAIVLGAPFDASDDLTVELAVELVDKDAQIATLEMQRNALMTICRGSGQTKEHAPEWIDWLIEAVRLMSTDKPITEPSCDPRCMLADIFNSLLAACETAYGAMMSEDFGTLTLAPQLRAAIAKAHGNDTLRI